MTKTDRTAEAARRAAMLEQMDRDTPEPSLGARLGQIGILGWAIVTPVLLGVLIGRWLDMHWQAVPSIEHGKPLLHWLDLIVPIAIGGVWVAAFVWQLKRRALIPVHDPQFEEAVARD